MVTVTCFMMISVFSGQAIPAGLHVRMNLETGLKEAKLMDGDDGSRYEQVGPNP